MTGQQQDKGATVTGYIADMLRRGDMMAKVLTKAQEAVMSVIGKNRVSDTVKAVDRAWRSLIANM
uniref:Uncharacterized protein n=1 Tax=Oryza glumipatula TaxID=40148 RepID=A0A0D9Z9X5_9ORYZ